MRRPKPSPTTVDLADLKRRAMKHGWLMHYVNGEVLLTKWGRTKFETPANARAFLMGLDRPAAEQEGTQ